MKKLLVLCIVAVFVLAFTVGILADEGQDYWDEYMQKYGEHVGDDGVATGNAVDPDNPGTYTILNGYDDQDNFLGLFRNQEIYEDNDPNVEEDVNDQEVSVRMEAVAYIPCYLEMILTGNQGQTTAKSFGPGAVAAGSASQVVPSSIGNAYYHMVFENEIGGYVDEEWYSLGHGQNAEIEPAPGVYIQSCDMFKVEVYGNEDYRYEVELTQALTGKNSSNSGEVLPLDMRTKINDGSWWTDAGLSGTVVCATMNPTEEMTAYHNFRVPYNRDIFHGKYKGVLTFRAVTL